MLKALFDSHSNGFLKKKYHNGWKSSIFAEGASINQPLLFTEENILEVRMKIFLEFVDRGVWDVV